MQTFFGHNEARKSPVASSRRAALTAALLASALAASAPALASTYTVKHPFAGADGGNTFTSLIKVGNIFYGTTTGGGTYGQGTIFQLSGNTHTVLYNFTGGADGGYPRAGLTYANGLLYGTTVFGGTGSPANCTDFGSCGTVFQFPIGGSESVLWNFQGGTGGANPFGGLVYDSGKLYGTTMEGGSGSCVTTYSSCGTVFSLTTAGTPVETVLYAFQGGSDGANPFAAPIMIGGRLYGTTTQGGVTCTDLPAGCGTVYRLKPVGSSWTELVEYRFQGGNDGADPFDSLVKSGGTFWGTTFYGGASHAGIVFNLTPASGNNPWTETIVHTFTGGSDGGYSNSGLTKLGTTLFGVTSAGGTPGCQFYYGYDGCGTIYKVVSGNFLPVYAFDNSMGDGGNPYAPLLKAGTSLYGTTYGGGTGAFGTLFKFTP